jgi:hypothetical protein
MVTVTPHACARLAQPLNHRDGFQVSIAISDQVEPSLIVILGLVPRIHVDAHGSSPWAEGARVKPGHDSKK